MAISIPNIQPPFSLQAFTQGFIAAAAILALLFIWMFLRADDTKMQLQSQMPSKAAIIETITAESHSAPVSVDGDYKEEAVETVSQTPINVSLSENVDGHIVPRADIQTGITPFQFYRRPSEIVPGNAALGIILMDAGLAKALTLKANETLPADVTMAFNPYADGISTQAASMREAEREIWLHLPLQNENYPNPDPGPATILLNASIEQNSARMVEILSLMQGYAGLISYPDHAYYNVDAETNSILPQIFGRGLGFIEGRTDKEFYGAQMATENLYPFGQIDILVTDMDTPDMVERKFVRAENLATQTGQALIMLPLTPLTVSLVREWVTTLDNKSIQLLPASALLKNNE